MTKLQKQLAENIRFYRKKKGMTQENLAEKVGTATNYIGGLKQATKIELPVLMASFFRNSLIYCHFRLKLRAMRLLRKHFVAK